MNASQEPRPASRYILPLAGLALFFVLLYRLREIVTPILLAFIIAYLFDPLVDRMEVKRFGRTLAIAVILLALLVVGLLVGLFLLPYVQQELVFLFRKVPDHLSGLQKSFIPWVESTFHVDLGQTVGQTLARLTGKLKEALAGVSPDVFKPIFNFLNQTVSSTYSLIMALVNVVMVPLFAFYFLRDFDIIKEKVADLVPPRHRERFVEKFCEVDRVLGAFVRGQLIVCASLAVIYTVGLLIVGIDLAVVIGVTAGICNLVPYLGTIIGFTSAAAVALLQFGDLWHVGYVAIVFVVAQLIEGNLLTPLIVGESVGLHPVVVIVAILVAASLFGFLGVLLAVPATAALKVFFSSLIAYYRESEFFTRDS